MRWLAILLLPISIATANDHILFAEAISGTSIDGGYGTYVQWAHRDKGWVFPFTYGLGYRHVKDDGDVAELVHGFLGYSTIPAVRPLFAPMASLGTVVGAEKIKASAGNDYMNSTFGIFADASLLLSPWKRGIVIRAGAFSALHMNSDIVPWEWGLHSGLGVTF